jgi:hypothetical protein
MAVEWKAGVLHGDKIPKIDVWENPEAASVMGKADKRFVLAQGTGNFTNVVQPDYPRNIYLTFGGAPLTTCSVTITGINSLGASDTETSTSIVSVALNKAWASITSITLDSYTGGAGSSTIDVGHGVKFGLTSNLSAGADVFKVNMNNLNVAVSNHTVDTTYNTIVFQTAPNGVHDYQAWALHTFE